MRPRPPRPGDLRVTLVAAATASLVVALLIADRTSGDYQIHGAPGADNAGPPLAAIVHGRLAHLAAVQPVMGLVSLLWRAPFVGLAAAFGGGGHLIYLAGCFACLLPVVGLVGWLAARATDRRQLSAVVGAALLMLVSMPTVLALRMGHPEEVLTAVLATAAVLAAERDHRGWAAVLLGLSVGAKEWAVLAAPAVLLALPAGRRRAAGIALLVAALASLPLPLLDPSAFHRADTTIGPITVVGPLSLWWPICYAFLHRLPFGMRRPEAAASALALAAVVVVAVGRRARARGRGGPRIDAMALLALLGLLRCVTDPADLDYYLVAAIVPLAVWEVGTLRRSPTASVTVWGIHALCFSGLAPLPGNLYSPMTGTTAGRVVLLAAALVLIGYLTVRTFVPPPAVAPAAQSRDAVLGGPGSAMAVE